MHPCIGHRQECLCHGTESATDGTRSKRCLGGWWGAQMPRGAPRVATTLWGRNGLTLPYRVYSRSRVNLEKMPMNLTIKLPDENVAALKAEARAGSHRRAIRPAGFGAGPGARMASPIVGDRQGNRIGPAFHRSRLTRRLRQREKPGAKPTRTPSHDPRLTGNTKHFPPLGARLESSRPDNFSEIISSEPEQQRR